MLDHELVAFVRISCILSSISPCFLFVCSFVCLFVCFYLFMHLVSSFSCMVIQESSFAHSFVGLYRIYYLLWQEQSSVKAFNFLYKWTLPAFGENIRGIDIQKGTYRLQLARLSFWDVSDCTRWHTFTVSHTIG